MTNQTDDILGAGRKEVWQEKDKWAHFIVDERKFLIFIFFSGRLVGIRRQIDFPLGIFERL